MLQAATPAHADFLHRLLREGAAEGAFEQEIGSDSALASLFFAALDGALATGYLRVPGPEGRLDGEVHVAGYVYAAREGAPPVGFGLFREVGGAGSDFELWLTGVAVEARGRGHGRAMMRELLATPPGRLTSLVRCTRKSAHGAVALKLFRDFGFATFRMTPSVLWLVSASASPDLLRRIAELPGLG